MTAWLPRPTTNGLYVCRCLAQGKRVPPYGYVALWIRLEGRRVTFCHGLDVARQYWEPLSLIPGDSEWYGPLATEEEP
jgi:hypothetical protein